MVRRMATRISGCEFLLLLLRKRAFRRQWKWRRLAPRVDFGQATVTQAGCTWTRNQASPSPSPSPAWCMVAGASVPPSLWPIHTARSTSRNWMKEERERLFKKRKREREFDRG